MRRLIYALLVVLSLNRMIPCEPYGAMLRDAGHLWYATAHLPMAGETALEPHILPMPDRQAKKGLQEGI
jgi:hypothetical protein